MIIRQKKRNIDAKNKTDRKTYRKKKIIKTHKKGLKKRGKKSMLKKRENMRGKKI